MIMILRHTTGMRLQYNTVVTFVCVGDKMWQCVIIQLIWVSISCFLCVLTQSEWCVIFMHVTNCRVACVDKLGANMGSSIQWVIPMLQGCLNGCNRNYVAMGHTGGVFTGNCTLQMLIALLTFKIYFVSWSFIRLFNTIFRLVCVRQVISFTTNAIIVSSL
jgi:hypothetical protein